MANFILEDSEELIREAIKTEIDLLNLGIKVLTKREYISSNSDRAKTIGSMVADNKTEVRFLLIEFLNFADDEFKGLGACPAIQINYNFYVFIQFAENRSDETNSEKDFMKVILRMRKKFMSKNTFAGLVKNEPLTMSEFAGFGTSDLTDAEGHSVNLQMEVKQI